MRKRNKTSLGPARPARTIPIPITPRADTPRDRRLLVPLEPRLVGLADEFRPPGLGGAPAAWTSWAAADIETELLIGRWETPVVDGTIAGGDGIGFTRPDVDPGPIALAPATTAAAAGWAGAGAPSAERSWVASIAGLTPAEPAMAGPVPAGGAPVVARPAAPAATPPSAQQAAMLQHPSVQQPAASAPARRAAVDPEDFTMRLGRGAAFAETGAQLCTLAERALQRLSPDGRSRWLVAQPDDSLAEAVTAGDAPHASCAVRATASCPAIASGRMRRFERSDELDACPQLLAAGGPSCAVVCVPVASGPLRGVVQTTAPVEAPLDLVTATLLDRAAQTLADRMAQLR